MVFKEQGCLMRQPFRMQNLTLFLYFTEVVNISFGVYDIFMEVYAYGPIYNRNSD